MLDFSQLNEEQRRVLQTTKGPILVMAGAGSGKTLALTCRIAHLLMTGAARPEQILAVTFTNKAAGEMRERIRRLVGTAAEMPTAIGTFHSVGARLLREQWRHHARSAGFAIIDADDSERMVRQVLREHGISNRVLSPVKARYAISQAKTAGLPPEEMLAGARTSEEELIARMYGRYQALLQEYDSYDFDDLLVEPIRLLERNAPVRRQYQNRWRFLSVDEYQDTNALQERFLRLVLNPERNICVVGDDYQAIYSWRGARVDHILQFEQDYSPCTTIYLTQNYRSTPAILDAANAVIADNLVQKHKTLWTGRSGGRAVQVAALFTDRAEAAWVRGEIEAGQRAGQSLRSHAVLYRTNAQSRLFEEEFIRHGIPYVIVGGFKFYERREVKEALALLQLVANPVSFLALNRLAQHFLQGFGPKTLERLRERAAARQASVVAVLGDPMALSQRQQAAVQPLLAALAGMKARSTGTVHDSLVWLLERSGYAQWLKAQPDGDERWENVEELLNVTVARTDLTAFLEEVSLLGETDTTRGSGDRGRDCVTCMTLHAAKGLEFDSVFVTGCEEGLLPHRNADSQAELEEERRLLYVGMTRAKDRLTLSLAHTRYARGQLLPQVPSRFLQSLPAAVERVDGEGGDVMPLDEDDPVEADQTFSEPRRVGEFIVHPRFGRGVVIQVSGSLLTCVFEEYGVRTLNGGAVQAPQ